MALRLDFVPTSRMEMKFWCGPVFFSRLGVWFILTMTISGRPSPSRSPIARSRTGLNQNGASQNGGAPQLDMQRYSQAGANNWLPSKEYRSGHAAKNRILPYNESTVAVFPMGRREFLAALASLGLLPSNGSGSSRYPVHFRKANPYDHVLAHIEPGTDEFPFEKEAQEIEGRLSAMLRGQALPLASDFTGAAPLALRYRPVA